MNRDHSFEVVRAAIAETLASAGVLPDDVTLDSSLVLELHMDSLAFVDLAVALERQGLPTDRMQGWIDQQLGVADGFRVASLVALVESHSHVSAG